MSTLGQLVLKRNPILSHDPQILAGQNAGMETKDSATRIKEQIIARTKEARESAGYTQEQVSTVLGIEQGRYKMYETRSPLPYHFIDPFCTLCRVSPTWLITGKGERSSPTIKPKSNRPAA
jgi:DNA-binding XRE family transcriptional regulator